MPVANGQAEPLHDLEHVFPRHPTIKMLAHSFLILIGMALVGEGAGFHIPKGYIYFAMAFTVAVEMVNIRTRKRAAGVPVRLHRKMDAEGQPSGE